MDPLINEIREYLGNSCHHPGEISCYSLDQINSEYPAWIFRFIDGSYGAGIPYCGEEINEKFNDVKLYSENLNIHGIPTSLLLLTSANESAREQFAFFCLSFVDPGADGFLRRRIESDPTDWWQEWKQLVGNSAVDKKPYAVIGEMIVLMKLLQHRQNPHWGGPDSASRDIETALAEYEVKSTLKKYGKTVTINGQFQLQDTKKNLYLVFNRFEPKNKGGVSINILSDKLTVVFDYSSEVLEDKLSRLGYPKGSSARNERYELIEQLVYQVDSRFPAISANSFVDGHIPDGIISIEYKIDLNACSSNLIQSL